jgi:small subunit ribosomal protein S4
MARYTGPVCRLCRRDGLKLFLKGTRCDTPKCAIERRENPPGQQQARRGKLTDYGQHLREKQKVKHYYGVLERQFRRYYHEALKGTGNTGDALMVILERRLDNVVHRLGFGQSRAQARQMIRHGHITVNGKKVTIPSMLGLYPTSKIQHPTSNIQHLTSPGDSHAHPMAWIGAAQRRNR